jgi:hypothetical protein
VHENKICSGFISHAWLKFGHRNPTAILPALCKDIFDSAGLVWLGG